MPKAILHADIKGNLEEKSIVINGKLITLAGFIEDLKAEEEEPGDNWDIYREFLDNTHFSWGELSSEAEALSLALRFYLHIDWVMCRFFVNELEKVPQGDFHLIFNEEQMIEGYDTSEALFAEEFTSFMGELGAIPKEQIGLVSYCCWADFKECEDEHGRYITKCLHCNKECLPMLYMAMIVIENLLTERAAMSAPVLPRHVGGI